MNNAFAKLELEKMFDDIDLSSKLYIMISKIENGFNLLKVWKQRVETRRILRNLAADPHFLDDIGVTSTEWYEQANKPFWKA